RRGTGRRARGISGADAGCEDPDDRHYNQPIRLDREQAGDRLKRADHLYDFIVEIDHNTRPRIAGRGSAVFLHLARDNFGPTAGCVSMTRSAMLHLLRRLGPRTKIVIGGGATWLKIKSRHLRGTSLALCAPPPTPRHPRPS